MKNKIKKIKLSEKLVRRFCSRNFLCKSILRIINLDDDIGVLNICSGKPMKLKNLLE